MQNILSLLKSHRSIRKYKADPIPDDLLTDLLNSSRQAPTSSNLQAYSIIVVKNQETKKSLAHLCGDQPWVESCPVFLVLCPDLHRLAQICAMRGYEINDKHIELFTVAVVDTALVAQNILVGAESLGLGGCMIGSIRNNPAEVSGLLELPDRVFPLVGLCLGYPDQDPMIKPRLPEKAVIHHEKYDDIHFEPTIKEYDKIIQATGLYDGPKRKAAPLDDRIISDIDYSWSEHSARRAASKDPKATRAGLKAFLESRGFHFD
jgi:nitroreductase